MNTLASCVLLLFLYITGTVAVAVERCHNCLQGKCNNENECLHGCILGFAGPTCSHECTNCIDSVCNLNADNGNYPCSVGCTPGHYGLQCNTPCTDADQNGRCDRYSGTAPDCGGSGYGQNCEISCLSKCNGFVCDNKGRCMDSVCIPGRWGSRCRQGCEVGCKVCNQESGKCIILDYKRVTLGSQFTRDTSCHEKLDNIQGFLSGVIVLLVMKRHVSGSCSPEEKENLK